MTEDELAAILKRNPALSVGGSGPVAVIKCNAGCKPLAEAKAEKAATGMLHIRFVSVRKRLCDPDNVIPKWTLDALRYVKVLRGDEPDKITLETTQRKAEKGEEEHTLIEVFKPC